MSTPERVTELELRYTHQQDLIEELNGAVLDAHRTIEQMEKRMTRLEQALEQVLYAIDVPLNEKPPHY